mmetsp:Transcript_4616/g.6032  ORF Transcript_4616/g.6032 Transcript_4616/m.6032 type:complete len:89 (+) Transcript_4616:559-825(+)
MKLSQPMMFYSLIAYQTVSPIVSLGTVETRIPRRLYYCAILKYRTVFSSGAVYILRRSDLSWVSANILIVFESSWSHWNMCCQVLSAT